MAQLLALETSTDFASVALWIDGQTFQKTHQVKREAARVILAFVDELLKEHQLSLQDLDAIAFGRGPGSFTGVRLAASVTQGLAFGARLPVIPVSTLKALAYKAHKISPNNPVLATIDARMDEVYSNTYHFDQKGLLIEEGEEQVSSVEQLSLPDQDWVALGTGVSHYQERFTQRFPNIQILKDPLYPEAKDMLALADKDWSEGKITEASLALPVYIRNQVAKLPKSK